MLITDLPGHSSEVRKLLTYKEGTRFLSLSADGQGVMRWHTSAPTWPLPHILFILKIHELSAEKSSILRPWHRPVVRLSELGVDNPEMRGFALGFAGTPAVQGEARRDLFSHIPVINRALGLPEEILECFPEELKNRIIAKYNIQP